MQLIQASAAFATASSNSLLPSIIQQLISLGSASGVSYQQQQQLCATTPCIAPSVQGGGLTAAVAATATAPSNSTNSTFAATNTTAAAATTVATGSGGAVSVGGMNVGDALSMLQHALASASQNSATATNATSATPPMYRYASPTPTSSSVSCYEEATSMVNLITAAVALQQQQQQQQQQTAQASETSNPTVPSLLALLHEQQQLGSQLLQRQQQQQWLAMLQHGRPTSGHIAQSSLHTACSSQSPNTSIATADGGTTTPFVPTHSGAERQEQQNSIPNSMESIEMPQSHPHSTTASTASVSEQDANENPKKKTRRTAQSSPAPPPSMQQQTATASEVMLPTAERSVLAKEDRRAQNRFRINIDQKPRESPCVVLFPWILHDILDKYTGEQQSQHQSGSTPRTSEESIISWQPDGGSFRVHNQERFVTQIMKEDFPQELNCSKWEDFTDMLSNWGFVHFESGPYAGSYIHRLLARGRPSLCKQMRIGGKTVTELVKHHSHFAVRLHAMLTYAKKHQMDNLVSWDASGRSFTVHNFPEFLAKVFGTYCTVISENSFIQKLQRWGFTRTSRKLEDDNEDAQELWYHHEWFCRDEAPKLIWKNETAAELRRNISPQHDFLGRLRLLLDESPKLGFQTIISWLPHGKAFLIYDRPHFVSKIMPLFFRLKFATFRQALRSYGFTQMGGVGWNEGAFYHSHFVRDDPILCKNLTQAEMKGAMPTWIPLNEEPDFYSTHSAALPVDGLEIGTPHRSTEVESGVDGERERRQKRKKTTIKSTSSSHQISAVYSR